MNLESSVEHARVCVWRVVWQGRGVVALERVRIRRTPRGYNAARRRLPCNRACSELTQRVSAIEGTNLNTHGTSRGNMSGQLRNQGSCGPIPPIAHLDPCRRRSNQGHGCQCPQGPQCHSDICASVEESRTMAHARALHHRQNPRRQTESALTILTHSLASSAHRGRVTEEFRIIAVACSASSTNALSTAFTSVFCSNSASPIG